MKSKIICHIKQIADKKGMSLNKISHLADVSYPTIDRMSKNKTSSYNTEVLAKLCKVLDISISELLEVIELEEIEELRKIA